MDEQKTSVEAADQRQRRVEMIGRIMLDYRQRQSVNGLRIYEDANFRLNQSNKSDRFNGEAEFLSLMTELVDGGQISLRKSNGERAENKFYCDPSVAPLPSGENAGHRAGHMRAIGGKF
jgi:hypothetical protein